MNARSRAKHIRQQAAIKHTQLYLSKVKVWSADFTTARAPKVLAEMDRQGDNINKALARLTQPQWPMPLETIRDAALTYYGYYEKRSRWREWIALGQAGLVACEQPEQSAIVGRSIADAGPTS